MGVDGRTIADAAVSIWSSRDLRAGVAEDLLIEGRTDRSGEYRVASGSLRADQWEAACATATAPGFVHGWIDSLLPTVNEFVLRAGVSLSVRCTLRDGNPLDGVRLACSLTQPERRDGLVLGRPVGPPEASQHTAASDAEGRARIDGLLPGRYVLAVEHDWAMLRTRLENGYYVTVHDASEQELELVFEEPLVVAFALPGRPTIRWFVTPQARMPAPHPGAGQYGGLVRRLRREAEQLGLGDSFYSFVVTRTALAIGKEVQVVRHVPGIGWDVASVPFVEGSRARLRVLDPVAPVACAERVVRLQVARPDGSASPLPECRLELVAFAANATPPVPLTGRSRTWTVACDRPLTLPCGRYRLRPARNVYGWQAAGDGTFEVAPGNGEQVVSIAAAHAMARVRLDALTPEGAGLSFFHVRAVRLADGEIFSHTYSEGARHFFVPAGEYRLEVHLAGFEVARLERSLGEAGCEEVVVLTRAE
ncbi:MAG: hypothetical protein KAI24_04570 [Planctomycetes bacterium]|nr:hypothetical protein [Planctomycetota bacterium]